MTDYRNFFEEIMNRKFSVIFQVSERDTKSVLSLN